MGRPAAAPGGAGRAPSPRLKPRRLGLGVYMLLAAAVATTIPGAVHAWRPPPSPPAPTAAAAAAPSRDPSSTSGSSTGRRPWRPLLALPLRQFLSSALPLVPLVLLPAAGALAFPGLEDCVSESNPSFTVVTCDKHFGIENGRPKKCQASENCISTSSVTNPSKYSSPWVFNTNDVNEAFLRLVKVVKDNAEALDLKIVEIDSPNHYLHAEGKSKVPPGSVDDLEFKLDAQDSLAFFRTGSRQSVFVYPVQQPLSDRGTLKKRLDVIQRALGWQSVNDYYEY